MKFLITTAFILLTSLALCQQAPTELPYKRFPGLPPIQLLLSDSSTKFTKDNLKKDKPVLLMIFSPECNHCQHTAEEMVLQKDKLKDIQIVMASMFTLKQINDFYDKYNLKQIPNLVMGKDIYFLLPPFYGVHSLPYLAFYNKEGEIILGFEGSMSLEKILATFQNAR